MKLEGGNPFICSRCKTTAEYNVEKQEYTCYPCTNQITNLEEQLSSLRTHLEAAEAVVRAAKKLLWVPAVQQVLGSKHTKVCNCPKCEIEQSLARFREVKRRKG